MCPLSRALADEKNLTFTRSMVLTAYCITFGSENKGARQGSTTTSPVAGEGWAFPTDSVVDQMRFTALRSVLLGRYTDVPKCEICITLYHKVIHVLCE